MGSDPATLSPLLELTPTPYALYAKTAGNVTGASGDNDWIIDGDDMYSAVSGNVGIGTSSPSEVLDVNGHINSTETYKLNGNTVLSNQGTDNIFVGQDAGSTSPGGYNSAVGVYAFYYNTTGSYNSAMGSYALHKNTTGRDNSAMGYLALHYNTTGIYNSAVGSYALVSNSTGEDNSAMGYSALRQNTTGGHNSAIGANALSRNTTGSYNTGLGSFANWYNEEGSNNTIIGYQAGSGTSAHNKSGNIFIGYQAGFYETDSNTLYIENSSSSSPLIYGEFDNDLLVVNGTLDVNGPIYQRGGVLHADYVFETDYPLESIEEHSESMWSNKHLPAVPQVEVDETGNEVIDIGSHQRGMLEELEKAHIYIEQLHKRVKTLEQENAELAGQKLQIQDLQRQVAQLKFLIDKVVE